MAQELGASNVLFAGQVTDEEKVALIKRCRAMVLPSHLRSEAFGMVLVEAAMLGRPMVSCEIGTGTSYVNLDGETGFVVPPEDPDALAEALGILLVDNSLATRLGLGARTRYERMFSGPALGRAYSDLYREVTNA
jgi:rhamnosyl/mannosyltransferase